MKSLGFCAALVVAAASMSMLAAQSRSLSTESRKAPIRSARPLPAHETSTASSSAPKIFADYCFECHGTSEYKVDLSIEKLIAEPSVGASWEDWERIAEMLDSGKMPPKEATLFPTDTERSAATAWIRGALAKYEADHAGDPGRVTVRRLTSAEYAYSIRDLTGIDVKVGIDASSDSVGGEGFANFGDVQFVQDTVVERYLEAAKQVADHAIVGSGPLAFYTDPGKSGLELAALEKINGLYRAHGFRVVS